MSDSYTNLCPPFLKSKQEDDDYWDEKITRRNLESMTPLQRKNNPQAKPMGDFTGRCKKCGSNDLWDDITVYGCNKCGAMFGN